MPIRQRKPPLAVEPDDDYRGRHPMLKHGRTHFNIWNYIRTRPGLTSLEVQRALSTGHQRIRELITEGLVVYGPPKRLRISGKTREYPTLIANESRAVGTARTRVQVKLTVYRNERGEYYAEAKTFGEMPTARIGEKIKVTEKTVNIIVPKIEEIGTESTGSCVIDAEYVIIP